MTDAAWVQVISGTAHAQLKLPACPHFATGPLGCLPLHSLGWLPGQGLFKGDASLWILLPREMQQGSLLSDARKALGALFVLPSFGPAFPSEAASIVACAIPVLWVPRS